MNNLTKYNCINNYINRNELDKLIQEYIDDFINKKDYSFVVSNSIPIVWFGNLDDYEKSANRILTIGLNPSKEEFPLNSFPRFNILDINLLKQSNYSLINTLNNYFNTNPYKRWFSKYNKLLSSVDASYGGVFNEKINTAIHIDIYSAIATDPTWGHLFDNQKIDLQNSTLFDKLLNLLNPDIIFISVNKQIFNEHFSNWKKILENKFLGNNYIKLYKYNNKKLIFGTNFKGIPFGGIKEEIAIETIKEFIFNN